MTTRRRTNKQPQPTPTEPLGIPPPGAGAANERSTHDAANATTARPHDTPDETLGGRQHPEANENIEPRSGLICLECGRTPDHILLNKSENRLEHAARVTRGPQGVIAVCGGQIVPLDTPWYATLLPGSISLCTLRTPSRTMHRVRLGRAVNLATGSWTGTPLCSIRPRSLWFPIPKTHPLDTSACNECEREFTRINTRHERPG